MPYKVVKIIMAMNNGRQLGKRLLRAFFALTLLATPFSVEAGDASGEKTELTGRTIMEEAFKRHELYPYVFEEQTMIMTDFAGNRDVRKLRRFSRVEKDGTVKFLLVFDNPPEVRGVALLAVREQSGVRRSGIYMPAFGKELKSGGGESRGVHFLGTDFAVEDLTAEILSDFRYVRTLDQKIEKVSYFVVEAFPKSEVIEKSTGYGLRRHFVRQDNYFIVRTDYYDRRGRFFKRKTNHDLKRVNNDMWRANMVLMENHKEKHQTLIKITKRVFSHNYVPAEMFSPEWLLDNRHYMDTEERLMQDAYGRTGKVAGEPTENSTGEKQENRDQNGGGN